jgi:hypothetical protein
MDMYDSAMLLPPLEAHTKETHEKIEQENAHKEINIWI